MASNKQLILITAPFNCGYCETAKKELPSICEENGFELIEMENENKKEDALPVDLYPTIMIRVDEQIKDTINGYSKDNLLTTIKKY
tara:strand:- start:649 stop:906 length:258 start_codon:yes stop_codon:yes gene_type:complete